MPGSILLHPCPGHWVALVSNMCINPSAIFLEGHLLGASSSRFLPLRCVGVQFLPLLTENDEPLTISSRDRPTNPQHGDRSGPEHPPRPCVQGSLLTAHFVAGNSFLPLLDA